MMLVTLRATALPVSFWFQPFLFPRLQPIQQRKENYRGQRIAQCDQRFREPLPLVFQPQQDPVNENANRARQQREQKGENHLIRLILTFLLSLLSSAVCIFIYRVLLGLEYQWQWFTEALIALGNSVAAVIFFPLLDKLQVRE